VRRHGVFRRDAREVHRPWHRKYLARLEQSSC
jgi:hypothetical protein